MRETETPLVLSAAIRVRFPPRPRMIGVTCSLSACAFCFVLGTGRLRWSVNDDVFAGRLVEAIGAAVERAALGVLARLNQNGEAALQHVFDDARGAGAFLGLVRIEA